MSHAPVAPIPAGPGGYALLIRLDAPRRLRVGRLGVVQLEAGDYLYCGSALRGLEPRVRRHLRRRKKRHWHIDAVTAAARPSEVWLAEGLSRTECDWSRAVLGLPGAAAPVSGFGASDCRCPTHLARLPPGGGVQVAYALLAQLTPQLRRVKTDPGFRRAASRGP